MAARRQTAAPATYTASVIRRLAARNNVTASASENDVFAHHVTRLSGDDVLLEIDVQGAMQVRFQYPDALMIFIMPPDETSLLHRLKERGRETPEQMANSISLLLIDLTDPDFYEPVRAFAATMRQEVQSLLYAAVEVGELPPCDTARLARAVQTTFNGTLILWAIDRQGALAERVRDELRYLLEQTS